MGCDVNAEFAHDGDGFGADAARVRAGAFDLEAVSGIVAQKTFRHRAAGGVSCAENEDSSFLRHGSQAQQPGAQHGVAAFGLRARMKALKNLPSTCGAMRSTSTPCPVRKARASSTS